MYTYVYDIHLNQSLFQEGQRLFLELTEQEILFRNNELECMHTVLSLLLTF